MKRTILLISSLCGALLLPVNLVASEATEGVNAHTDTIPETKTITRVDTIYIEKIVYAQPEAPPLRKKRPFLMAIKTNLLYDLGLLPNLSIELPFGRKREWSALIEGNWSWWDTGADRYNYHRIQLAGIELRRWLPSFYCNCDNTTPLTGWYIGAYGYGGDYDIRLFADKNSDLGQQSLWTYSAGLTAGYSMIIGKRFNLAFGIGAGYIGGEYSKYNVSECKEGVFPRVSRHERNYFGVTKAEVSLVWLIGKSPHRQKGKEASR